MNIALGATNINDIKLGTNQISKVYVGSVQVWEKQTAAPNWFYVEDVSGQANTIDIKKVGGSSAPTITIEKSTDGTTWTTLGTTSTTSITAIVPANGKLYLRAAADTWATNNGEYNRINMSGNCNVGGSIMSLLYGSSYTNQTTFPNASATNIFDTLFDASTTLLDASALDLPATTLLTNCYCALFAGCSNLTSIPVLPASTLAPGCYASMFAHCTSLTAAPTLPVMSVPDDAYSQMFNGCTSLTTAPALPATTVGMSAYNGMFYGCTSLTTAPATLPATTLDADCYAGMFHTCTALTTAPEIMATSTTGGAFTYMFYGCSSLSAITIHVNDGVWDGRMVANAWTYGVAASGTFTMPAVMDGVIPTNDVRGIPAGWSVVLT